MTATTDNPAEGIGPKERSVFGLHAMLAFAAAMLLSLFLGGILQLYSVNVGLLITEIAFIAIPAAIVLRVHRKAVGGKLFGIPDAKQVSLTALIGGCIAPIVVYLGIAIRKALIGVDTSGINVPGSMWPLILVLSAPLCEELMFRPVIQSGLARNWGNRAAILLTAVLFALFHVSLLRFAETFFIGLFAGIVFLKTRNFWCAVVVHCLCNALGPVLWRSAPQLTVLLNPGASIGLSFLALAGCYYLGEKSPARLRGLWQRLNWAAFGTAESLRTTRIRSPKLALLTATIVVCLVALLGVGHAVTMRQLAGPKFKSNYVVSQEDQWTVVSAEEIRVRSTLVIKKLPEPYEDLLMELPFHDAAVHEVRLEDNGLPFTWVEEKEYRTDLSPHQDAAGSGTITVLWSFPITCLAPPSEMGRYSTPLKSLVPSYSFSLTVTIADDTGFQFSVGDSEARSLHGFSGSSDKPKMDYGNWGGLRKREDKHTGGAQPGAAADAE